MNKFVEANKKIEKTVVSGYKTVEHGVVGAYQKIEDSVVGGYKKIEDKFVNAFLAPDETSASEGYDGAKVQEEKGGGGDE